MLNVLHKGLIGVHMVPFMKNLEEQLIHCPLRLNWMQLGSLDAAIHAPFIKVNPLKHDRHTPVVGLLVLHRGLIAVQILEA
jgi:hypothetical protein